jgi:hypothetical protein
MSRELRDEIRMARAENERLTLERDRLYDREAALSAEVERLNGLYHDLLMQVGMKHPGETRHETARRYIQKAEYSDNGPSQEQSDE